MTRTARASYPNALNKDRSQAKNGMDKHVPKDGAGTHNWGRLEDEYDLETAALDDEQADLEDAAITPSTNNRPAIERRLTPEEVHQGLEIRKKGIKSPDVDLGAIARTAPVISASPVPPSPVVNEAEKNTLNNA